MVLGKDMKHNKNGKESDVAQKRFIWFENHAKLKHKMLRDKLIKSIIAKCRLYTAFHLLGFFCQDTAAYDGPDPQPVTVVDSVPWLSSGTSTAHGNAESGPNNNT